MQILIFGSLAILNFQWKNASENYICPWNWAGVVKVKIIVYLTLTAYDEGSYLQILYWHSQKLICLAQIFGECFQKHLWPYPIFFYWRVSGVSLSGLTSFSKNFITLTFSIQFWHFNSIQFWHFSRPWLNNDVSLTGKVSMYTIICFFRLDMKKENWVSSSSLLT